MPTCGLFMSGKIAFPLGWSKLKTNIRINTHGLDEKEAVSQGMRSNILWSWAISFDMKKICFRRQKEIVCDICFMVLICFKKYRRLSKKKLARRTEYVKKGLDLMAFVELFSTPSMAFLQPCFLDLFLFSTFKSWWVPGEDMLFSSKLTLVILFVSINSNRTKWC